MDADEIALAHQFGERVGAADADRELIAVRLVRVVEHDVHVEGLGAARGGGADAAHADHAEGADRQPPAERVVRRAPVAAQVRAQLRIVIGDALGQRHHQGDRVVGDLARAVVRHIADRDAQLAEALDVDIVVADAVLHEDPALAQLVDVLRRAGADDRVRVRPLFVRHVRGAGAEIGLEA